MHEIGTDYVILSYDVALNVFNLAAVTEHRSRDEQVALLRLAGWLDLVPGGAATDRALGTWRMTDTDEEHVTHSDEAAALDAAGILVKVP